MSDTENITESIATSNQDAQALTSNNSNQGIRRGRGFKNLAQNSENASLGVLKSDVLENEANKVERSIEGWTIFVVGIHPEATEEDVTDHFSEFGKVKTCHLNLDRNTGYVKGYSLVEFEEYNEAEQAVTSVNNTEFLGHTIRAQFAFIKSRVNSSEPQNLRAHTIQRRLGPRVDFNRRSRDTFSRNERNPRYDRLRDRDREHSRFSRSRNSRRYDRDDPRHHDVSYRNRDGSVSNEEQGEFDNDSDRGRRGYHDSSRRAFDHERGRVRNRERGRPRYRRGVSGSRSRSWSRSGSRSRSTVTRSPSRSPMED